MRKLFSAALAALCAVSCILDAPLYRDTTMAQVVSPTVIKTDAGLTYNITEQYCDGTLEAGKRVFAICTVMKKKSETEYDVRLVNFILPLVKETVSSSTAGATLGIDPITINSLWVSGGYMNMRFTVQELEDDVTHTINLEWLDTQPADTLRFVLHHDDGLDRIHIPSETDDGTLYGFAYASFPIKALVPAGFKEMPIKVSWTWDKEYCIKDDLKIVVE